MGKEPVRILVAGSINTDLVVRVRRAPEAGETVTGTAFDVFGGGKGANQAVAAARAGGYVAMLGGVGNDEFGKQRSSDLEAEDIETSTVSIFDGAPSGVALITVEASGENRIAYVPGAGKLVSPENALDALDNWKPDIILSTLELDSETLMALFQAARNRSIPIICNATPEPAEGRALIALSDVLIVNETEAIELTGAQPDGGDWKSVANALLAMGPSAVIITLGQDGALVMDANGGRMVDAMVVGVVDTTGAGDAFCGAFVAEYAAGSELSNAAAIAAIAGSLAVTRSGAQPSIPDRAQIDRALANQQLISG